jgi:hypothetical protein
MGSTVYNHYAPNKLAYLNRINKSIETMENYKKQITPKNGTLNNLTENNIVRLKQNIQKSNKYSGKKEAYLNKLNRSIKYKKEQVKKAQKEEANAKAKAEAKAEANKKAKEQKKIAKKKPRGYGRRMPYQGKNPSPSSTGNVTNHSSNSNSNQNVPSNITKRKVKNRTQDNTGNVTNHSSNNNSNNNVPTNVTEGEVPKGFWINNNKNNYNEKMNRVKANKKIRNNQVKSSKIK